MALLSACGPSAAGVAVKVEAAQESRAGNDPLPAAAASVSPPPAPYPPPTTTAPVPALVASGVAALPDFQPGEHVIAVSVGSVVRQWTIVVPPARSLDRPAPLLVLLHGVGGRGSSMRTLGFEARAAAAGVVVAYPDAYNGSWNDGRPGLEPLTGAPVDDVVFLRTLIDETAARAGIDPTRVAMVGFSNGAMMTSRAACDLTDRLTVVAMVAGAGPQDLAAKCHPTRALPMEVVFGTADRVVPYAGGQVAAYNGKQRGISVGVADLLGLWSARDGCKGFAETPLSGTTPAVTEVRGVSCGAGSELVHFRHTGGHEWLNNASFDTTSRVWEFCRTHLLPAT